MTSKVEKVKQAYDEAMKLFWDYNASQGEVEKAIVKLHYLEHFGEDDNTEEGE